MVKKAFELNRLPLYLSAAALAVALGRGAPDIRSGHAADPQVTPQQRQTLATLQDAFSSIAESVEPAVVGIHVEPVADRPAADRSERPVRPDREDRPNRREDTPGDSEDEDVPGRDFSPFGDLPFQFRQFPFGERGTPGSPRRGPSTGSGVIIHRAGNDYYLLTTYHVVEGGGRIKVQFSDVKDEVRGTLVGKDTRTDLAVVKVRLTDPGSERRVASFGNSDTVKTGQWAIAIGNPLDVGQTLTVGVVSAKGRSLPDRIPGSFAEYTDMIQTDASINPGNSGGALLDINGRVIGINTAIASPTRGSIGIGFAIPGNTAREVANQIIRNGEVVRGWLGVNTSERNQDLSPALARMFGVERGAFVDEVIPDSPAAKAGIRSEDVITRWGNTPITGFKQLSRVVGNTPPGQDVPVTIVRERKEMTVTVRTEKRADEETLQRQLGGREGSSPTPRRENTPAPPTAKAGGLTVRGLTPAQNQSVGTAGVVVTAVEPGSAAAESGVAPGTVIHRVNQTPVRTPADFTAAMRSINSGETYVMRVSLPRGSGSWSRVTLEVRPEQ